MKQWMKAIPEKRDRLQAKVLVWTVGVVLAAACLPLVVFMTVPHNSGYYVLRAGLLSLTFAAAVWALRAATPMAALCGGMVCLLVTLGTESAARWAEVHSGLVPLMALFVLTFAATRTGKSRKRNAGLEESRRGRNAAQVLANLGASGVAVLASFFVVGLFSKAGDVMVLGVLAEATADTVSSEIGSAFGGRPFLITTFKRVDPGTDGALSLLGTIAGLLAAAIVVLTGMWSMTLDWRFGLSAWLGGIAGLCFDSLLGATVERRGYLGNDLVNFSSTVVAALAALAAAILLASKAATA
jgi:uncharacterized protein (TIGR00297 family)